MSAPYRVDRAPRYLRLVLGPKAAADAELRSLVEGLRRSGIEAEVRLTWEPGDGERLAREAIAEGCEAVIGAGGDGLVTEIVGALAAAARSGDDEEGPKLPALGLLPYGTGNDFATAAGLLPGRPSHALRCVTRGEHRPVDVVEVRVDGQSRGHFLNMATAGSGAEATVETSTEAKRWLGSLSYLVSGLSRVSRIEALELRVEGADFEWQGRAFFLAIGNGRTAAGGIPLCPRALADDGLFDLALLPEMPFDQLLPQLGERLFQGSLVELESLVEHRSAWLELESPVELQVNLDGEPIHGRRFRFEIVPNALRLFAPPGPLFGA
jgi:lipid kinase YegS